MTKRTGWDQIHYKYYQILFPTTIHVSKSELKRLRYPKNRIKCVSTIPETITFDPTIGFSIYLVLWKLDIQSFLRTPKSVQSEFGKAFKYAIEVRTEKRENDKFANVSRADPVHIQGVSSIGKHAKGYKYPQTPHFTKIKKILGCLGAFFWTVSLSFLSNFSPKPSKHIQSPLILLFSPQSQSSVLAPNLPILGSLPWI